MREVLDGREAGSVPFFLSIDVEPDEDLDVGPHGPVSWSGLPTIRHDLGSVRAQLEDSSGSEFRVGWYLRMDPQIEALCGRPDHVAHRFADDLDRISASADYLGLHVHATRWDGATQGWVADRHHPDVWLQHMDVGLDAFTASMGSAPLRHRFTADLRSDAMVKAMRQAGVQVDVKPASAPPRSHYLARPVRDPYLPGPLRFGGPLVIPCSSTTLRVRYGGSVWRSAARRLRRGPFKRADLSPYLPGVSPEEFWDAIARSISSMSRPYVSIGFRTQPRDSWSDARQRAVLQALVDHPLARVVRFADPLELVRADTRT
jgi:hypothetical protein